MKQLKASIIGMLSMIAMILLSPTAKADMCDAPIYTHYHAIYCGIGSGVSEDLDEDIIEILADQYDMDEELIEEILANTICDTVIEYTEEEQEELPEAIRNNCLPSGRNVSEALGSWSIFTDIRNSYAKEAAIQQQSTALEFKFKASEQYWNGTIMDAPFDLIVDLNLIEIVLFGSKAQWMDDVYSFPSEEEEEGEEGPAPADELLPEGEAGGEGEGEGEGEAEPEATEEEGGEIPPECVPPDDPDADLQQNPQCGNGTLDVLMGETCDDGNQASGDGCNQYCQTEATGSNDICIDPDSITFKTPEEVGLGPIDGSAPPECPEGTVPKKDAGISGEPAGAPAEVPQSPEYPGPFLGGTLKQVASGPQPPCPEGYFDARATEGGASASASGEGTLGITVAGEQYDIPRCLPTEFCADFNAVRDALFGEGWEDDDAVMNIAPAIESLFCVNILKENRPQSPYKLIEGCVDCHITAMVDALEKALQTNVSPLKNTTSAFGISAKNAPNFSFNLVTASKTKLKYNSTGTAVTSLRDANDDFEKSKRINIPLKTDITETTGSLSALAGAASEAQKREEAILEDTYLSNMANGSISEQEVGARIKPLLGQMRDVFINIQKTYEYLVEHNGLDKKGQCPK